MVWNITRDYLSATRKIRRRRKDFPRFRGNVNDVDVIFGSRLRHSALMEFRAVSTWYDHIFTFHSPLHPAVKVKLPFEDWGVYCFGTCRSASWSMGMSVGKSVSPPPNCHLQLENAAYKLRTLITIRRWSLSLGRLVGHVKTIVDFVVDGREGGGVLRKTSVPFIVSPWLYKAYKYNYEFSLWHG